MTAVMWLANSYQSFVDLTLIKLQLSQNYLHFVCNNLPARCHQAETNHSVSLYNARFPDILV